MKKLYWLGAVFCLLAFSGCSSSAFLQSKPSSGDLEVTDMQVSVGAVEGNKDIQVVHYQISFQNTDSEAINLKWIEPVLQDVVASKATDQNHQVTVDKTISPDSSLTVTGSFHIDTRGLTKSDKAGWQYITQIKISVEQILPVPAGDDGS